MRLPIDARQLTPIELLQLHSFATEELKRRDIVRTSNNPIGDYTEWLVAAALNLKLESNSKAGFDALGDAGLRVQIKGRRVTPRNPSRQLNAIRNLESSDFDDLVAVVYDEKFNVDSAYQMPHQVVRRYATYRSHDNAHILILKGAVLQDPETIDLTAEISGFHSGSEEVPSQPVASQNAPTKTTTPGYINKHNQQVIRKTGLAGTDHNQKVYHLRCLNEACGAEYGANGSDIHLRKCPECQNGAPGLAIENDGVSNAEEIRKVQRRLKRWAANPMQVNTQILAAYLRLKRAGRARVYIDDLRSDFDNEQSFTTNFVQMHRIGPKNHGKVFELDGDVVSIWPHVQKDVDEFEQTYFSLNKPSDPE